jgi:hypothetical protein
MPGCHDMTKGLCVSVTISSSKKPYLNTSSGRNALQERLSQAILSNFRSAACFPFLANPRAMYTRWTATQDGCKEELQIITLFMSRFHCNRFRFRSSVGPTSSSSRSAVSAGLRREWTLLARLLLRVAGAECRSNPVRGNLGPPIDQETLSPLNPAGVVSDVSGGLGWRDEIAWRRGAFMSYWAN